MCTKDGPMVKILYIDDDIAEHKFFAYFLKSSPDQDAELICLDELDEAVKCLAVGDIDYVFLDDRFSPYMSCLETLPKIQPVLGTAKIAVISSSIEASHLKSAAMLGVDKVFDKVRLKDLLKLGIDSVFDEEDIVSGEPKKVHSQNV